MILDWDLYSEKPAAEWRQLHDSPDRQNRFDPLAPIGVFGADRGFDHRYLSVASGVLGHNFWIVARLLVDQRTIEEAA